MGADHVSLTTDSAYLGMPWPGADDSRGIAGFLPRLGPLKVRVRIDRQANEPLWLPSVLRRMRDIGALSHDWDGEGAKPPTDAALSAALSVLGRFMVRDAATPAVVPTLEGGIQFEWHDAGWDVQVEIDPSGAADAWGEHAASETTFSGEVDSEDLRLAIKEITVHLAGRQV